jgi:hypothetical protein
MRHVSHYASLTMHKRSSKQGPEDINEAAFRVVDAAIREPSDEVRVEKNQAAVELGRLGGLKGGRARADKLSSDERIAIARRAAAARWNRGEDA